MPAIALLFVFASAGRGIYVDDRLVWFLLILIPAGPSAMLLVSVAELVDISQGAIAGYLTVAVRPSPYERWSVRLLTLMAVYGFAAYGGGVFSWFGGCLDRREARFWVMIDQLAILLHYRHL